jgi:hypothetical protein
MTSFNSNKEPDLNQILIHDFSTSRSLSLNGNTLRRQNDYTQITRLTSIFPDKTVTLGGVDYQPREMYLMGKHHNIDGLNQAGEIMIKHTHSNENELFVYIPVMVDPMAVSTPVGNLVSEVAAFASGDDTSVSFNLARALENETRAIQYSTGNVMAVVFVDPVYIPEYPDEFRGKPGFLPKPNMSAYSIIPLNLENDDQIYIDCNPTGESADTIAAYNIPINSEYAKVSSKSMFERHATFAGMFLIALVGVYMVVPWFYRTYVIESIIEWYDRKESSGYICKKHDDFPECAETRIAESNTIFWILAMLIVSLHFFEGIVMQDSTHLALSMYIFIAFIGAVLAIMMKSNDPRFYYHKSHQLYLPREEAYSNFGWPSEVLGTGLSILGIKEGKTQMPWYVVYVLLFLVTFIIGIMIRLYGKGDGMSYQALAVAAVFYSTTLTSFLITIFNRESNVYTLAKGDHESEPKTVKAKPAVDDQENTVKQITNFLANFFSNVLGQRN